MASRNADVNLIIRAKTEGDRAIATMADAIQHLVSGAGAGNTTFAEFGQTIAALDKAAAGLAGAQDKIGTSAKNQAAAVHQATASIAEQQARIETLRRGYEILARESDKAFIGPRRSGLTETLRLIKRELSDAEGKLSRYTSTLDRNLAALQTSRSGLLDLKRTTSEVTAAQNAARTSLAETTAQLEAQTRAAEANGAALAAIKRSQPGPSGKSAETSASVFAQGGLTHVEQDFAAADRLREKLNPLAAVQARFNAELARYQQLAARGRITTEELAQAEAHLKRETDNAAAAIKRQGSGSFKASIFGLKPYELQNLSYQINDVVSGIASGQKFSQILAQQGGQILQLFPKVGDAILAALGNPLILGFVATLGLMAAGLAKAAGEAERLRDATADLGRRANGGDYKPTDIAGQEKQLERLGATATDARAAIGTFVDLGVPAASLQVFGKTASSLAEVLGIELPDAAKQVGSAFTGGFQAVAELDNRLNFLTATQRDHIRQLFEEGRAEQARTEALGIFSDKMNTAAENQRGPWAQAARDLNVAYSGLLNSFANTAPIQEAINLFTGLANVLARVAREASGAENATDLRSTLGQIDQSIRNKQAAAKANPNLANALNADIAILQRQRADVQKQLDALTAKANKDAKTATQGGGDTPAARARKERIAQLGDEGELQRLRDAGSQRVLTLAEQTRRIQLAGAEAFRQEQDAAVGAIRRQNAAAHETAAIQKETATRQEAARAKAKAAAAEQRRNAINGLVEGRPADLFGTAQKFEGKQEGRDNTSLTDFFKTAGININPSVTAWCAAFVQAVLAQNGLPTAKGPNSNTPTLSARGFLTYGTDATRDPRRGDIVVSKRGRSQAQGHVGFFDSFDDKGNVRIIAGNTGNKVARQTVKADDVLGIRRAPTAAQVQREEVENLVKALEAQDRLNLAVKQGNEDRQRGIDALKAQFGKDGLALIDVQRVQEGDDAVEELRQRVARINEALPPGSPLVEVTPEQVAEVRRLAVALFDVQRAKEALAARLADAQRPVADLTEQRDILRDQSEYLRSIGQNSQADKIEQQIVSLNGKIREAYDTLIAFYRALSPEQRVELGILNEQQLQNTIDRLKQAKQETEEWGKVAGISARDIAQAIAGSAAQAFTNFINKVAAGKNVFKSLASGIREFAANFIASIAQMIIQLLAFAAAVAILRAWLPEPAGAFGSAPSSHTGGIVGQDVAQRRVVSPLVFAGAMRYHTGGIAGLAPDEQATILRKGEEVLTENDPRHRNNGGREAAGAGGGVPGGTNVYNLFDRDQLAEALLRSPAGEKHIINVIGDNPAAVKAVLG